MCRYKDGRALVKDHSSSLLRNFDQRDLGFEDSLGETISHLSLDCVSENDAGYYECVAHNSNGQKTTVGTEVNVVSKSLYFVSFLNEIVSILYSSFVEAFLFVNKSIVKKGFCLSFWQFIMTSYFQTLRTKQISPQRT